MPWEENDDQEQQIEAENPYVCPLCGSDDCVPPAFGNSSDVLLIGIEPEEDEIIKGKPFVGRNGRLLESELHRISMSLYDFRVCNMWLHPSNKNEDCFERSIKIVLKEAKDKRVVVLVGAETVKYFTGEKVSEYNGLLVESPLLQNPFILAMEKVSTAFRGGLGELRFALDQIKFYVEEGIVTDGNE